MRIEVKSMGRVEDTENVYRYQVLVNQKNQGTVLNTSLSKENSYWQIENDKSKTAYPNKEAVVEAICAKNGRKLKNGKLKK